MGSGRAYLQAKQVRASGPAGVWRRRSEHPLLELQRTAGNRAVAGLIVQRREKPYFSSMVAVAPAEHIYAGKCDAKLEGASVRKKWSRGLTGKDTALILECGPESFRFSTFRVWLGDRFPWAMDVAGGSAAFVTDPISDALDDISDDTDDAGTKFWSGYHTIKAALASDLKHFCRRLRARTIRALLPTRCVHQRCAGTAPGARVAIDSEDQGGGRATPGGPPERSGQRLRLPCNGPVPRGDCGVRRLRRATPPDRRQPPAGPLVVVAGPPVATGYVDLGHTGRTELRIHGVGGTSPQELLDHPHPVQVAGDATSGFYRRWDHDSTGAEQPAGATPSGPPRHVEGFSWGGMTSGSARRALWLLLIPFLLVNVAHWALPGRAAQRRWANTAAQRVLRLLALSLTMTLALAAAETGVDLLARQCGGTGCFNSAPSWLSWLRGHPQVLTGLGALLPLAAMVLLGVLGRQTWKVTERVNPKDQDAAIPRADGPALADPMFWAGAEPVRRLRAAHFAAGLAVAAIVQILPVLDSQRRSLGVAVLATAGLVIALTALLVFSDGVARPHHRRLNPEDLSRRAPMLAWAATVVFLIAVIVDLLPHALPAASGRVHVLPRLDGLVQGLFGAQIAMLVLVGVFVVAAGLRPDADQAGRRRPGDRLVGFALAALAWLVAWFFTAGLTVRVAQTLLSDPQRAVPSSYTVAGALIAPGGAFILLGIGIRAWRWYRRERARQRKQIVALSPPGGPAPGADSQATTARVAALASARARAGLLDIVPQLVVAAVAAAVVLASLSLVLDQVWLHLATRRWVQRLADLGTLLLGLAILRFLATARKAWKQGSTRRTLGILWDLGSFWPRAAHPLAPPCYCERALPQLQTRLAFIATGVDDHVVVAGHSQGSVIAAALMLMHRPEQVQARMSLLTYGCPLSRLYVRAFPGYLGPQVLGVGQPPSGLGVAQPDPEAVTVRSRSWRWLNLYRDTDPIGGYVDRPIGSAADEGAAGAAGQDIAGEPIFGPSGAIRTGEVDVVLVDPDFAVPTGDIFPTSVAGHSHYREDPTYEAAVAELL